MNFSAQYKTIRSKINQQKSMNDGKKYTIHNMALIHIIIADLIMIIWKDITMLVLTQPGKKQFTN